jgi:hypothetical protein
MHALSNTKKSTKPRKRPRIPDIHGALRKKEFTLDPRVNHPIYIIWFKTYELRALGVTLCSPAEDTKVWRGQVCCSRLTHLLNWATSLFKTRYYYVAQAGLAHLGLSNPLASASQLAGTTSVYHHTQLLSQIFSLNGISGQVIKSPLQQTSELS